MTLFDDSVDPLNENTLRDELTAKWKDKPAEELLKAKVDSDLYIKTLERQKDELRNDYLAQREELLAKAKFEDLLTRFESSRDTPPATPPAKEVESPKVEQVDLDTKLKQFYAETRAAEKRQSNIDQVQEKLKERFGNAYQNALRGTGLSDKQILEIAGDSPEAVYRLVGLDTSPKENFQTPPRSVQRNDNFAPRGQPKRDYAYYQELKKSNPKLYLDPKIAVQMHNDAIELGEAFGLPD